MNELTPANAHQFLKRYQFRGARLRSVRIRNARDLTIADVRLALRAADADKPVHLRLMFTGVEEFRFQRRPSSGLVKLKHIQFGFFGSLTYVNLDPFPEDGPPKVMDFRASDSFLAARTVGWEAIEKPKGTNPV